MVNSKQNKINNGLDLFLQKVQCSTGNLKFVFYLTKQHHGEQYGDRTFEASCSSFEPHLLTQGDLNDPSVILNFLKKPAELL